MGAEPNKTNNSGAKVCFGLPRPHQDGGTTRLHTQTNEGITDRQTKQEDDSGSGETVVLTRQETFSGGFGPSHGRRPFPKGPGSGSGRRGHGETGGGGFSG